MPNRAREANDAAIHPQRQPERSNCGVWRLFCVYLHPRADWPHPLRLPGGPGQAIRVTNAWRLPRRPRNSSAADDGKPAHRFCRRWEAEMFEAIVLFELELQVCGSRTEEPCFNRGPGVPF